MTGEVYEYQEPTIEEVGMVPINTETTSSPEPSPDDGAETGGQVYEPEDASIEEIGMVPGVDLTQAIKENAEAQDQSHGPVHVLDW